MIKCPECGDDVMPGEICPECGCCLQCCVCDIDIDDPEDDSGVLEAI
jgi:hypothetical protein